MSWLARLLARNAAPPRGEAHEPTEFDRRAMHEALDAAREAAALGEVPVGGVIYETASGRTLAVAANRRETDADPTGHAELLAIRAACKARDDWRLTDCTLVVTLEPCLMCAGAIVNARVGRVVYGAADPKAGACESLYRVLADARLNHRPAVVAGLEAQACGSLLREFFRELRASKRRSGDPASDSRGARGARDAGA